VLGKKWGNESIKQPPSLYVSVQCDRISPQRLVLPAESHTSSAVPLDSAFLGCPPCGVWFAFWSSDRPKLVEHMLRHWWCHVWRCVENNCHLHLQANPRLHSAGELLPDTETAALITCSLFWCCDRKPQTGTYIASDLAFFLQSCEYVIGWTMECYECCFIRWVLMYFSP
jgi:hypothetical protein